MSRLEDLYINRTREYLKREAQRIIEKAQLNKETGDDTGAQMDSYGALIFYNGGLVYSFIPTHKNLSRQKYGISASSTNTDDTKHKGWKDIPAGHGWDWAKLLRNELKAGAWGDIPKRGFCLIVFNAAFYSVIHEKGGTSKYRLKKEYKILSMVVNDLKQIQSKFKKQGATLRGHHINIE